MIGERDEGGSQRARPFPNSYFHWSSSRLHSFINRNSMWALVLKGILLLLKNYLAYVTVAKNNCSV